MIDEVERVWRIALSMLIGNTKSFSLAKLYSRKKRGPVKILCKKLWSSMADLFGREKAPKSLTTIERRGKKKKKNCTRTCISRSNRLWNEFVFVFVFFSFELPLRRLCLHSCSCIVFNVFLYYDPFYILARVLYSEVKMVQLKKRNRGKKNDRIII